MLLRAELMLDGTVILSYILC